MKYSACVSLLTGPLTGHWYRVVDWAYINSPLATAHTLVASSRFNAGTQLKPAQRYACLYFADDNATALLEAGALMGKFAPGKRVPAPKSIAIPVVNVTLQHVADLSDVAAQKTLSTNAQELTGDWEGYTHRNHLTNVQQPTGRAPTQLLGLSMKHQAKVEAFMSVSARDATHKTLIVFPQNLRRGSSLSFHDTSTGKTVVIKGGP